MINKILKEINRLKKELNGYSALEALDYIEAYINTLPEEHNEDLEEAAKRYATEGDEINGLYIIDEEVDAFKAGAEWQKQKMMNDVFIDDYIVHDGRIELEGDPLPSVDPIILLPYPEFKHNDKVKIIIIKE